MLEGPALPETPSGSQSHLSALVGSLNNLWFPFTCTAPTLLPGGLWPGPPMSLYLRTHGNFPPLTRSPLPPSRRPTYTLHLQEPKMQLQIDLQLS